MKLFNVYITKSKNGTIEDLVAVRNGGTFWAFLFNVFWFIQHKMWKESGALILIHIFFFTVLHKLFFSYSDLFIIEFGLSLIIAFNAHYWYGKYLMKRGYQFFGCVFASNKEEAKLIFIRNCFKAQEQGVSPDTIFSPVLFELKKPQTSNKYFSV